MLKRVCRYQAAIVREDHHILLIQHREHASGRTYWVVPGGGLEDGESEEECVCREAREETNLEVDVVRLLIDEPAIGGTVYERWKTYLCRVVSGEASPGTSPSPKWPRTMVSMLLGGTTWGTRGRGVRCTETAIRGRC